MNHPQITKLSKAFRPVFKDCYFEYAQEGDLKKGKKQTGKEVDPVISDKIKMRVNV